MSDRNIDVYRVGFHAAIYFDVRAFLLARKRPYKTWYEMKHAVAFARKGNWRRFRQLFHGWHAEHRYAGRSCGVGVTRGRALADLRRHLDGAP